MIDLDNAAVAGRLAPVSLHLAPGERLGLIGPSGAGKTTLLSLITGRIRPTSGSVRIADNVRLGYIPQDPGASLLPRATAAAAIIEPVRIRRGDITAATARVPALLRSVLMPDTMATRPVEHLSGGQRQRVAVCRAHIDNPQLIVADEALSALDEDTSQLVEQLLVDSGATVICVAHDMEVIRRTCTTVAFLHNQRVAATGPVAILEDPPQEDLARFLQAAKELAV